MTTNIKKNTVNETLKFPLGADFEHALSEALGRDEELVIALIDLDSFDAVNKNFSNDEGDRVLIETGRYLMANKPEKAELFRMGGDEFGLIFKGGEEREEVFLVMEALRRGYCVKLPDGAAVTLSIGIASAPDDAARFPNELIRKADGAIYRAKVGGRNRVCLAKEEKMVTKTSHYTANQLQKLTRIAEREGVGEAVLLREALDALLRKYDRVN